MRRVGLALLAVVVAGSAGCSVRRTAIDMVADTLAASGETFASDDDPDLIRDATPFSLKLMESILTETPEHRGLLTALCRGFAQYAYAFVELDAERVEDRNFSRSMAIKRRARNLYLRARDYGLRGLETAHPGFAAAIRKDAKAAETLGSEEVELAFWSGMAWCAAVALSKDDPVLVGDLPLGEALVRRAFALEPDFDHGAIHQFLIPFEGGRPPAMGGSCAQARSHFQRAVELTEGLSAAPYVAFAETVCVQQQGRAEFEAMLKRALSIDADARPAWRLSNTILQRRARRLLEQAEDLFPE